jgi:hypothetical protein
VIISIRKILYTPTQNKLQTKARSNIVEKFIAKYSLSLTSLGIKVKLISCNGSNKVNPITPSIYIILSVCTP